MVKKEFDTDFRGKNALASVVVYSLSAVFIAYLSFQVKRGIISSYTWNAVLWLIVMFCSINAVAKNFAQDTSGKLLYQYILHRPAQVITAKILYSALLLQFISGISVFFYILFMKNPIQNISLFAANLILVNIGLATILVFLSSISHKAAGGAGLLAILAFPVLIPVLLFGIKISYLAIEGVSLGDSLKNITLLCSIDVLCAALVYILFPYLWKN
ncbi:MAG: heme exporter protein CcmB [Cytophagales bacterium]|nr:heme exporter protein CcmB [Cytophagales bacterium]